MHVTMRIAGLLLIGTVVSGCENPRFKEIVEHPVDTLVVVPDFPRKTLSATVPSFDLDGLARVPIPAPHQRGLNPDLSAAPISRLADAMMSPRGQAVLFDSYTGSLRAFDSRGGLLWSFGGMGRGPGEFASPSSFVIVDDSTLVAGDGYARVHVFKLRADGWTFDRYVPTKGAVFEMCYMHNTLYVLSHSDAQKEAITSIRLDTGQGKGLAVVYRSDNNVVRQLLSIGAMACDPALELIYVLPHWSPEIYAFNNEGEIEWISRFPEARYLQATVWEHSTGVASGMGPAIDSLHFGSSLVVAPGTGLLVQLAVMTRDGGDVPAGYDTYVVDRRSGAGGFAGRLSFRVLDATGTSLLLDQEGLTPRAWLSDRRRAMDEIR